jgi:hypothetical protein
MKYSIRTHIILYSTIVYMTLVILNYLSQNKIYSSNLLIGTCLYIFTFISAQKDRYSHALKLNQVYKQQLLNRRLHDEINKLNLKFNESYKKKN